MESMQIKTASKQYPVLIGKQAINELPDFITHELNQLNKILIITDEKVAELHLQTVKKALIKTGKPVLHYVVPEGEHAKTFEVFYECQSYCLSQQLNRKSLIIALGGGAVGDLAGFVAATFMRGIPFIQVPTTLLAHDSAVGGKVAINHPLGKNMIGAFHQPEAVIYDLEFLQTLPLQELRSGFAEVIKHSLIADKEFYRWLKSNIVDLNNITDEQFLTMITKGIGIKASIVEEDEKEMGIRAFLNFGHTLGHAVEGSMGYGNFTHGESILIGMVYALKLSSREQGLDFKLDEFINWVSSLGYQTTIPLQLEKETLLNLMKTDKKSINEGATFVLLKQLGSPLLMDIADSVLIEEMIEMK
ncbi:MULTISPECIES: 3-dehydroquinate synthase [Peribacillus]|uniref:3-dehydroquinate synthase n=1 Tax=Peribacillus TaxID=2675229 RepID=UPI0006A6D975|nr:MULTISPECIES: 3-dehydroquinate synthase [Peribacillus]KON69886.1 3-dehydroquinate synthase [Peribacillus butanolivorans]MBK5462895.1 3-dehydroquinate synthase [Peribacillus sp. TH27]MBK5501080.1 3-dehydroquinate synthase [Peribacillus sp. TH14]WMX53953.1 3-dehydroquinate synthase [Peribacillus sp. R9-11]